MKVAVCLLVLAVTASAIEFVQFERQLAGPPALWSSYGRARPDEQMNLIFALKLRNTRVLERTLLEVSDPDHPRYGQHLTLQQIEELTRPDAAAYRAVTDWLENSGVDPKAIKATDGGFVTATVSVHQAEGLLNTQYHLHRHENGRTEALRCYRYSLPKNVAPYVDIVGPTIRFPSVRQAKVQPAEVVKFLAEQYKEVVGSGADPSPFNTPEKLRSLYAASGVFGKAAGNRQGVASFLEQYWSSSDLQEFFALFQNSSVGHKVAKQIGDNQEHNPGMEAELDVQYIMSVGASVETWVWYTAGRAPNNPENEPFLAWLVNVSSTDPIPNVFSVSYGEDEKSVGTDYGSRINTEFQKLGARGVSIMFASGDDGAGGNCTKAGRYSPDFPSGSPWVTAVGGTVGGTPGQSPTGEATDPISGGGFSDYWPRPSWQDAAVQQYFKTAKLPDQKVFNMSGRGYPDVAAQSEMFTVVTMGIPLPGVGGTSAASPTFSGIISLLNDLRIQNGKSSLGFLNPLLYKLGASNPEVFNDVTVGFNMGCPLFGFAAAKAWDPTTGWGSPNYSELAKQVLALP